MRARMSSNRTRSTTPRCTAEEWSRRLKAWTRSGVDLDAFAARRGISARSLRWWRWKLGSDTSKAGPDATALRLVQLHIDDNAPAAAATPAWEIVTARGHVFRVHRDVDAVALDRVLAHLARLDP